MTEAHNLQPEPIEPWELPITCAPEVAAEFNRVFTDTLKDYGHASQLFDFRDRAAPPRSGRIASFDTRNRSLDIYRYDGDPTLVVAIAGSRPRAADNLFAVNPYLKSVKYSEGCLTFSEGAVYLIDPRFKPFRKRVLSPSPAVELPDIIETQEPTADEMLAVLNTFRNEVQGIIDANQRPSSLLKLIGDTLLTKLLERN